MVQEAPCNKLVITHAPVAQLDRVSGYEPGGREFESLRARSIKKEVSRCDTSFFILCLKRCELPKGVPTKMQGCIFARTLYVRPKGEVHGCTECISPENKHPSSALRAPSPTRGEGKIYLCFRLLPHPLKKPVTQTVTFTDTINQDKETEKLLITPPQGEKVRSTCVSVFPPHPLKKTVTLPTSSPIP
jgi:hypothetical protein